MPAHFEDAPLDGRRQVDPGQAPPGSAGGAGRRGPGPRPVGLRCSRRLGGPDLRLAGAAPGPPGCGHGPGPPDHARPGEPRLGRDRERPVLALAARGLRRGHGLLPARRSRLPVLRRALHRAFGLGPGRRRGPGRRARGLRPGGGAAFPVRELGHGHVLARGPGGRLASCGARGLARRRAAPRGLELSPGQPAGTGHRRRDQGPGRREHGPGPGRRLPPGAPPRLFRRPSGAEPGPGRAAGRKPGPGRGRRRGDFPPGREQRAHRRPGPGHPQLPRAVGYAPNLQRRGRDPERAEAPGGRAAVHRPLGAHRPPRHLRLLRARALRPPAGSGLGRLPRAGSLRHHARQPARRRLHRPRAGLGHGRAHGAAGPDRWPGRGLPARRRRRGTAHPLRPGPARRGQPGRIQGRAVAAAPAPGGGRRLGGLRLHPGQLRHRRPPEALHQVGLWTILEPRSHRRAAEAPRPAEARRRAPGAVHLLLRPAGLHRHLRRPRARAADPPAERIPVPP